LSRYGEFYENRVTGERAVVLRAEGDGTHESGLVHLTVKPGGAVAGEHFHPRVQERFQVVSGTLGTRLDGVEGTLAAGEAATVPAGMPHDWWNAGDVDASVLVELSPLDAGPRFEAMIGTLFGLANAGKTNAKGLPNPFQLALVGREFADVIRFTKPPAPVQGMLFGLLGAIGRLRGYRAVYPEYLQPHGRTTPDPDVVAAAGLTPLAQAVTAASGGRGIAPVH
jgi:quercetin dioxygenase-like cupin family protein